MPVKLSVLEVYQSGELTVVGFGGRNRLYDDSVAPLHDEILELVRDSRCRQLAIDLTGVDFLPSGLLGVLASLRNQHVGVLLYNASDEIRDAIECTNLQRAVQLHEVAV